VKVSQTYWACLLSSSGLGTTTGSSSAAGVGVGGGVALAVAFFKASRAALALAFALASVFMIPIKLSRFSMMAFNLASVPGGCPRLFGFEHHHEHMENILRCCRLICLGLNLFHRTHARQDVFLQQMERNVLVCSGLA
jgi:hypothetical protein